MSECAGHIFCSTLKDSCSVLFFDDKTQTFEAVRNDPKSRFAICHHACNEYGVIVADKEGALVGLMNDCMHCFRVV
jgi:hypothetical protein